MSALAPADLATWLAGSLWDSDWPLILILDTLTF